MPCDTATAPRSASRCRLKERPSDPLRHDRRRSVSPVGRAYRTTGGPEVTRLLLALCALGLAGPVQAEEPNPLRWPQHRQVADWLSTGAVAGQVMWRVVE